MGIRQQPTRQRHQHPQRHQPRRLVVHPHPGDRPHRRHLDRHRTEQRLRHQIRRHELVMGTRPGKRTRQRRTPGGRHTRANHRPDQPQDHHRRLRLRLRPRTHPITACRATIPCVDAVVFAGHQQRLAPQRPSAVGPASGQHRYSLTTPPTGGGCCPRRSSRSTPARPGTSPPAWSPLLRWVRGAADDGRCPPNQCGGGSGSVGPLVELAVGESAVGTADSRCTGCVCRGQWCIGRTPPSRWSACDTTACVSSALSRQRVRPLGAADQGGGPRRVPGHVRHRRGSCDDARTWPADRVAQRLGRGGLATAGRAVPRA